MASWIKVGSGGAKKWGDSRAMYKFKEVELKNILIDWRWLYMDKSIVKEMSQVPGTNI